MSNQNENRRPVVVTTEFRGVFFGYLDDQEREGNLLTLHDARNCVYWTQSSHGFLGLAEAGPKDGCRIGPKVSKLELFGVTSISDCTESAAEAWEAEKWN